MQREGDAGNAVDQTDRSAQRLVGAGAQSLGERAERVGQPGGVQVLGSVPDRSHGARPAMTDGRVDV
ncbi:hypothetical protein Ae168Ps1_4004c [Pseudonocardia sp. Ae168_Ps1]|nr:hypothetical protein Ae168Ps1_4004c [Pseudonocardia sp. Ae168_Ps1]